MRILAIFLLSSFYFLSNAQVSSYEDLIFDMDSTLQAYKPKNKNYVMIRSKRGTGGVNRTSSADSIRKMPISDIVLVFTEDDPSDLAKRELANQERWDNLIATYPEFFQDNTNFLSICQCNLKGDGEAFKEAQGFYIYVESKKEPVAEVKAPEEKKTPEKQTASASKPKEEKKTEKKEEKKPEKVEKEKTVKAEKPKKEKEPEPEPEPVVKAPVVKREGYTTPKRSKNLKACRPPCYESGGEEIYDFFKEYLPISKKQKKQVKDLVTLVRLQLNFDGTIKKILIQGGDQEFNKIIEEVIKNNMNTWYPAVKGGVTIKSEVKLSLKYDNATKALRPATIDYVPRPAPKCTCVSDSQLFGE